MKVLLPKSIYILALAIILSSFSGSAQVNDEGFPFMSNYDMKEYMAAEANWSITQDHRGVMYFGNEEVILEYDGTNWRKIAVPGQVYIYSLDIAPDGSVFVGGVDDFGRLIVNETGEKVYESLTYLISDSTKVQRVWKTYADSEFVYFCTTRGIFKYNQKSHKINFIDFKSEVTFWTLRVEDELYVTDFFKGLLKVDGNELKTVSNHNLYIEKDIFAVFQWSKETLMVASRQDGISLLNTSTGEVKLFNHNEQSRFLNERLKAASIYVGVQLDKERFAFGTMNDGIYIFDKNGNIINHLNEASGLQSNIITNLYYTGANEGILWASLYNGIAAINLESPVRYFSSESGLDGALYGIAEHENDLYVSTMEGVSQKGINKDGVAFKQYNGFPSEISYAIIDFEVPGKKNVLIAGTGSNVNGLYRLDNGRVESMNVVQEVNRLVQSNVDPAILYVGTAKGILIGKYKNGRFEIDDEDLKGLKDEFVSHIVEDKDGSIWYNTLGANVHLDSDGNIKELPETIKNKDGIFFGIGGMVFFSAENTVYAYSYDIEDFVVHKPLQQLYGNKNRSIKKFFTLSDTTGIVYYGKGSDSHTELLVYNNKKWEIDSLAYRLISSMSFNSAYQNEDFVMLGGQQGLFKIDTRKKKKQHNYKTLIRDVVLGSDSLYFRGGDGYLKSITTDTSYTLISEQPIDYRYNNISFSYSAVFFEREKDMLYSSYLEGFDKKWSNWEKDVSRSYTNLKEGTYQFKVKAQNIYGVNSKTAVFKFEILPPWYRTWWAYIIYLIIIVVIIRILIAWYTRKLQEDKKRLEKIVEERTAEIVEKNQRIEKQNDAITDSIKYAQRIQNAVLPDKQTSDLFEYFIFFQPKDIVSGDFYWVSHVEKHNRLLVVAADCTGHGVPGAFMSMLGTSFLNEIVAKLDVIHSDLVLNELREKVITTLNQGVRSNENEKQKDGMDMALASIDLKTLKLEFSGANNPLILIRNNEFIEYKPDKMPIGEYVKQDIPFTRNEIDLKVNDVFYMFSDGYVDQFGGPKGRKYMKKRFKEFLLSIHDRPMNEQRNLLNGEMFTWMDGQEQIDDQIVIGMRRVK